jgi:hypothetical protein
MRPNDTETVGVARAVDPLKSQAPGLIRDQHALDWDEQANAVEMRVGLDRHRSVLRGRASG